MASKLSPKNKKTGLTFSDWNKEWRFKYKRFFSLFLHTQFSFREAKNLSIQIPAPLYLILTQKHGILAEQFTKTYYGKKGKTTTSALSLNEFVNLLIMDSLNVEQRGDAYVEGVGKMEGYLKENGVEIQQVLDRRERDKRLEKNEHVKQARLKRKEKESILREENEQLRKEIEALRKGES